MGFNSAFKGLKREVTFFYIRVCLGTCGTLLYTPMMMICFVLTALVLGVIGGIVLIGLLLLLIWKIVTSIHDRREYAKFEQERATSSWNRVSIIYVYKLQYALKQRH
jgi:uncharacterized membrane protein